MRPASMIGLITGFEKAESSRTGFRVGPLSRGVEQTLDAVEAAYNLHLSPDYFPYPPIGERIESQAVHHEGLAWFVGWHQEELLLGRLLFHAQQRGRV